MSEIEVTLGHRICHNISSSNGHSFSCVSLIVHRGASRPVVALSCVSLMVHRGRPGRWWRSPSADRVPSAGPGCLWLSSVRAYLFGAILAMSCAPGCFAPSWLLSDFLTSWDPLGFSASHWPLSDPLVTWHSSRCSAPS